MTRVPDTTVHPRFATFDFGLSDEQEERARRLHAESVIVDIPHWGPFAYLDFPEALDEEMRREHARSTDTTAFVQFAVRQAMSWLANGQLPEYRPMFDASGVTVSTHHVLTSTYEELLAAAGPLLRAVDRHDWLIKATRRADIEAAKRDGGHAVLLHCQPNRPHPQDLALIGAAVDLGLRVLQLTFNSVDAVGGGCLEGQDVGLTDFGRELVRWLNAEGVLVDVSHAGRRTTLEACDESDAPVICSHTGMAALHPNPRCKDDDELEAIAATDGVVGVVAVPGFLGDRPDVDVQLMLDHIDHAARVIGPQHVSIGTDWPNHGPKWMLAEVFGGFVKAMGFGPQHGLADPAANLVGFDDPRDFANITRGLVARGYADDQIRGILGENFLRVFGQACG